MTAKPLTSVVQHKAYQMVFFQLAGVVVLACVALLLNGFRTGFYVLLGGLSYGVSNLLFVWGVFRFTGAREATQFMIAFFFGEMLKLVLSAFLALLIVKYLPSSLLSVLVGFIGAIVSFWVACVCLFTRQPACVSRE